MSTAESVIEKYKIIRPSLIDPKQYSSAVMRFSQDIGIAEIGYLVQLLEDYCKQEDQMQEFESLVGEEISEFEKDIELAKLQLEEKKAEIDQIIAPEETLDETYSSEVILEVRAGVGGAEAALFANELTQMYLCYASKKGWKYSIMDAQYNDNKGLREAVISITGQDVGQRMLVESGVHRVQRIPETEAKGRVHTSTVTVAVLANMKEIEDMEIDEEDLKIESMKASGRGGQHVNKTESAIRITHLPTGITVSQQSERSQHMNKKKAMIVLKTKLLDMKKREQETTTSQQRQTQVGTGDRSEKIRTYNFPQNRVTDHRINHSIHDIERFLTGQYLDNMIDKVLNEKE